MTDDQTTGRTAHAQGVATYLRTRANRGRLHVEHRSASAYMSEQIIADRLHEADQDEAAAFYIELALRRGALE